MSIQQNKTTARRYREELWHGRLEVADEIFDDDCSLEVLDPVTPHVGRGPQAARELVTLYRTGFPDARFAVEEVIAEADRVALRWSAEATHTGEVLGVPATGTSITASGTDLFRIRDGKIVEHRVHWDTMGLLVQIGALPDDVGASK